MQACATDYALTYVITLKLLLSQLNGRRPGRRQV
jgi:hypothetical protein